MNITTLTVLSSVSVFIIIFCATAAYLKNKTLYYRGFDHFFFTIALPCFVASALCWLCPYVTDASAQTVFLIFSMILLTLMPIFLLNAFCAAHRNAISIKQKPVEGASHKSRALILRLLPLTAAAVCVALLIINPFDLTYGEISVSAANGINALTIHFGVAAYTAVGLLATAVLFSIAAIIYAVKKAAPPAAAVLCAVTMIIAPSAFAGLIFNSALFYCLPLFFAAAMLLSFVSLVRYAENDLVAVAGSNFLSISAGMYILLNPDGDIEYLSAMVKNFFSLKTETVKNKPFSAFIDAVHGYTKIDHKTFSVKNTGGLYYFENEIFPFRYKAKKLGSVIYIKDVSGEKKLAGQLIYMRDCDIDTGLLNKDAILRLVAAHHQEKKTLEKTRFLCISLSNYENFKGELSPYQERELLRLTADFINEFMLREAYLAYWGGGEYFIFDKKNMLTPSMLLSIAKKKRPPVFNIEGFYCKPEFKVGLYIADTDATPTEAVNRAVLAQKIALRGDSLLYTYDSGAKAQQELAKTLADCIRDDTPEKYFRMDYQPVIDIFTNKIVRAEALIRWTHPTLGNISPGIFIPVAEASDVILDIGLFVLKKACAFIKGWKDKPDNFILAVNISKRQIDNPGFMIKAKKIITESGADPKNLEFEVTETAASKDKSLMESFVGSVKQMGIRISLDDFGSGNTALAYISEFKCDTLKVDAVMSEGAMEDTRKSEILRAIAEMCHSTGMDLIIEHIDSMDAVKYFHSIGFNLIQGYIFSRPLREQDFVDFIKDFSGRGVPFMKGQDTQPLLC